jgi:hypothetical protein
VIWAAAVAPAEVPTIRSAFVTSTPASASPAMTPNAFNALTRDPGELSNMSDWESIGLNDLGRGLVVAALLVSIRAALRGTGEPRLPATHPGAPAPERPPSPRQRRRLGCDIPVGAVRLAASVNRSVRRGYYVVSRCLFGEPSATLHQRRPLPATIKQTAREHQLRILHSWVSPP